MSTSNHGVGVVMGLMVAAPLVTLLATAYQMWGTGGGLIRPTAVAVPAEHAPVPAPAGAANAGAGTAAAPAAPSPRRVPGRSAQDFTAYRPGWEAALKTADAQQGRQLAQAGKPESGVQACTACHGARGVAQPDGMFPTLAGQPAEYLAKQLMDYRDGARTQALMNTIAQGLDSREIGHLARYYASLPPPALATLPDEPRAARQLDVRGDNARALPACANCHGLGGRGEGVLLPRLAGQAPQYFIAQMDAFQSGQRRNDDAGVMQAFAQRLTQQEIEALARYYAGSLDAR